MSGDIDRGSNPRVEGRRGFRWRVETALALATFSCSRVREERGDGVKHSTTPDGQGVTTRSPVNQKTNPSSPTDEFPRIVDRDSTFARTTSASTRYTLPWITESASIPFCARETPLLPTRQPVLPVSLVVTRQIRLDTSVHRRFRFFFLVGDQVCDLRENVCRVSLRVAWLCYETHYVSIIICHVTIFHFIFLLAEEQFLLFRFDLRFRVNGMEPRHLVVHPAFRPGICVDLLIKSRSKNLA